jgi:hypothetical protein
MVIDFNITQTTFNPILTLTPKSTSTVIILPSNITIAISPY